MNKDKKIECQQHIINDLTEQNKNLTQQVEDLKSELLFEQNKINLGYERAQQLIINLEEKMKFYNETIAELKETQKEYNLALKDLIRIRKNYTKDMDAMVKTIKKRK